MGWGAWLALLLRPVLEVTVAQIWVVSASKINTSVERSASQLLAVCS